MFLAVIAFTLNSLRNYFMYNHQNLIDDDSDDDDETGINREMEKLHFVPLLYSELRLK
jgi:hypothetical protein